LLGSHRVGERVHPDVIKIAKTRSVVRMTPMTSAATLRARHRLELVCKKRATRVTHSQLHVVEVRQLVTLTRQIALYVVTRGGRRLYEGDRLIVEAKHDTPP
jgi:hypothetical protein